MSVIDVVPWKGEYYTQLLPLVREEDKEELQLLGSLYGYSWQQMLARSIATSNYLEALQIEGLCHGVIGVRSYSSERYSSIWFICSPIFRKYSKSFCRIACDIINRVSREYPILINCVSEYSLPMVSPFLVYCGFIIYDTHLCIRGKKWYPFMYCRDYG